MKNKTNESDKKPATLQSVDIETLQRVVGGYYRGPRTPARAVGEMICAVLAGGC